MPSSVLQDQVPHSILFPDTPLFSLPPRVFGSTYFVHIFPHGQDKLSAKSTKCIFLGYSRLQKGYKCYSLATHRYFISADVTFFESSPFFPHPLVESDLVVDVLPIPYVAFPPSSVSIPQSTTNTTLPVNNRLVPFIGDPDVPTAVPKILVTTGPVPDSSNATVLSPADQFPIAIRKGMRSTRNPHPIYNFLSCHRLYPSYYAFVSTLSSVYVPCNVHEGLSHPGWHQTMVEEMSALHHNHTWELVSLPLGHSTVGCRRIYTVKVGLDGSDQDGIGQLKQHLFKHFQTKDLGLLRYFLSIEVPQSKSGIVISQRKYVLDILEETWMLDCRPMDSPIDPNLKLSPGQGEALTDPRR
ncbi:uncharacterized protein LOC116136688 [Pistacia vera]|uniref:uncharacterized protein LOC116136688 n=1 Tax=Pistacia vera TaxID=55513 RepID=UPI001263D4B7|nr:uncharacterized protein LOC116136688 [Pistacia vera]